MENIEYDWIRLGEWFRDNYSTFNTEMSPRGVIYKNQTMVAKVGDTTILEENNVKLL